MEATTAGVTVNVTTLEVMSPEIAVISVVPVAWVEAIPPVVHRLVQLADALVIPATLPVAEDHLT
jgi:hypothetical protein